MNLLDLAIPVIVMMTPLFAGALKRYSSSKLIRTIIVDFVTPTISTIFMIYLLDILLVSTAVVTESSLSSDIWYILILVIITIVCWYGFFRLVWFGDKIADREHAGIQSDLKHGAEMTSLIIGPLFKSFNEKLEKNTEQIMQIRNDDVFSYLKDIDDVNTDLTTKINIVLKYIEEQNKKIDDVSDILSKYHPILEQIAQYFTSNPKLYEILLSRIEALKIQEQQNPDDDTLEQTALTSEDGRANRIIGHRQQDEMAEFLRSIGFQVDIGHGKGQPDYILKDKKGIIVAAGSNKSFTLPNEPKKRQRKIYAKDCQPEIILAKKLQIPMVLLVTNIRNKRRWAHVVIPSDLEQWDGHSTNSLLARDDEESGQILEEDFCDALVNLGGNV